MEVWRGSQCVFAGLPLAALTAKTPREHRLP